jgi:hypothetical protein
MKQKEVLAAAGLCGVRTFTHQQGTMALVVSHHGA